LYPDPEVSLPLEQGPTWTPACKGTARDARQHLITLPPRAPPSAGEWNLGEGASGGVLHLHWQWVWKDLQSPDWRSLQSVEQSLQSVEHAGP